MRTVNSIGVVVLATASLFVSLLGATPAAAQDGLTQAKALYASASYEEALQALGTLPSRTATVRSTEVAVYQVFCLLALGRSGEATQAIEAIVRTDPMFHPTGSQASPRLRSFFEDTRRPLLPEVVRETYAHGKDAFTRKQAETAVEDFTRVIALIDEIGSSADATIADLRTLASNFRELATAMVPPPAPPPAPEPVAVVKAPQPPPAPVVDTTRVYSAADRDVLEPVAVSRAMPPWRPANRVESLRGFYGVLEVTVDEAGKVTNPRLVQSVHPLYDPTLLKAAAAWQFRPATKAGVPVKFLLRIDVRLTPKE